MISGPTVLFLKSGIHTNAKEFEKLHENLKKSQILFDDPELASKHLNKVWNNVDDWWESNEVKRSRESFIKEAALVENNALEKWKLFLNNL
jgi:putative transferase (TIGR04331 family)